MCVCGRDGGGRDGGRTLGEHGAAGDVAPADHGLCESLCGGVMSEAAGDASKE